MWFSVRAVFIWLVMLAIPLQGVAASAMLHCGPGHERQMLQVSATDHHDGHYGADSESHRPGGIHQPDSTSAAPDAGPADDGQLSVQADRAQLGKFKCSACAQCCASVALLDRMADPIRLEPMSMAPVMMAGDYPKVAQTGPERPPRPFLA
ncbi:hypothetical protein [uncultured Methylibium sp.]|uniref:hypothetical protein n=1 Tax=uncultured Methylibium sp. TaxID=381093 RepID=UPI0025DA7FAB|nr:hypothetical protein [uncultured Methylibium sp.]